MNWQLLLYKADGVGRQGNTENSSEIKLPGACTDVPYFQLLPYQLPLSSLNYLSYWQEFFLHVLSHINRIYSAPIPAAIAPLKCLPHASKRIFHESSRSVAFNMFPHFIVVVRCNMRGMVEDPISLRFLSADCWCNLRVNVESSLRDRIRKIERERDFVIKLENAIPSIFQVYPYHVQSTATVAN